MNNRLVIAALAVLLIAAGLSVMNKWQAYKAQPTREQTAEDIGRDLFELAMAVCTANGGTLVPTQHDETGRVIAADCVTIDDRTEEVAP